MLQKIILSKFDVAERQLLQSIHMFFREEDPVSIHTLAEASVQILTDIGTDHGIVNILKESDIIKDEYRKDWYKTLNKAKNFFKHADQDKCEKLEFNPSLNEHSIFNGLIMYNQFKKKWVPETLTFFGWFMLENPNFIKEDSDLYSFYLSMLAKNALPNSKDKSFIYKVINEYRSKNIQDNNVWLGYGL